MSPSFAPSVSESHVTFEPEFVALLKGMVEQQIPFNQVLGLEATEITPDRVACRMAMRRELMGTTAFQRLHGGVISAAMDSMAGLAIMAAISAKHMDEPPAKRLQRLTRLGTIDMRVDYLRQGIGAEFSFTAQVLRLGSRVASTQMACLGADGVLIATGAAAYIVS